jgi:hypothetical protein
LSIKSPPASVTLELRASRALALAFGAIHGGAVVIALTLPIPLWWRLLLLAAIGWSLYRSLWQHALRRAAHAPTALELRFTGVEGECAVRLRGPAWFDGRIIEHWLHVRLVIVVVRCEGRRWPLSVVIPADAVDPEAFRRLRVGLTLRSAAA